MVTNVTRRQFLKTAAAAAAIASAPAVVLRSTDAEAWVYSRFLRKFVQPLPMPGPTGLPVMVPDKTTYPGVDYYQIGMTDFTQQIHPSLPKATHLYGYYDANNQVMRHLGGVIVAQRGTPVRIKFTNNLPATHMLPVDTTIPGAETGQAQNRAAVHLHGGFVHWMSDGGPFHWFAPDGTTGPSVVKWLPDNNNLLTDDTWYPNEQSSRLMWYHDHAVGITRLNAYSGLATAYIIRDAVEAAMVAPDGLPDFVENGGREIPLVVQDKTFKRFADQWGSPGDLWYPDVYQRGRWPVSRVGVPPVPSAVPEFSADTMLMNGVVYPYLDVEPRRYRFRLLNACNTRFLNLQLFFALGSTFPDSTEPNLLNRGPSFLQIGTEGGFLDGASNPNGVTLQQMLIAPAERSDFIIDFSSCPVGSLVILYNDAPAPFPSGDPRVDFFPGSPGNPFISRAGFGPNTRTLMQFRVGPLVGSADPPLNLTLPAADPPLLGTFGGAIPPGTIVRDLTLNENFDPFGRLIQRMGTSVKLRPNTFARGYLDPATETPRVGTVEAWRIFNLTGDTHPIHFHLVNVQIISRQPFDAANYNGTPTFTGPAVGPDPNEMGWKETVRMNPGECTTVLMKWDLPTNPPGIKVLPRSPRTGHYEYVYHCHILEHEEHDMMRPLVVRR